MSEQEFETQETEDQEFSDNFEQAFEPAEEPVETPEETPETFEFQGRQFTRDQLDPVVRLAAWANDNPERWEQLRKWESGELTFAPADAPVIQEPTFTPEPEIDPYDESYLRSLGEKTEALARELETTRMAEANAAIDAGIEAFSQSHPDLSKDEIGKVLQWVHDRRALESIPPQVPYAQKLGAVKERFEEGFRVVFYDRVQAESTRQTVNDMTRRRRAAAASSSPVSAPRVSPVSSDPNERKAQYIDAMAQALAEENG